MAEGCAFCAIVAGDVDADFVLEDETCVGFLDHRPVFPGHTLLVPKEHHETLPDLPDELLTPFFSAARLLARAMEEVLDAEGSFVAINNRVSQSVPHLHAHVVPRRRKDGLRGFFWPRHRYESDAQRRAVRDKLRAGVERLRGS